MLRKLRKSSGTVTLVLIGVAALSGCSDDRRDVYASKEDCLADWGNKAEDCTPSTDPKHAGRGFFYGPAYVGGWGGSDSSSRSNWSRSTGTFSRSTSRSVGSTSSSSSRGGFGSSGSSSSSS